MFSLTWLLILVVYFTSFRKPRVPKHRPVHFRACRNPVWSLTASSKVWDFVKGQKSSVGPPTCQPCTYILGSPGDPSKH